MLDSSEDSRLLDILGNRNRRRIIELLRQKPCFVTEISDRLMISPKAVIEHLHLMEEHQILTCQIDARRRKYYYLARDISVMVSIQSTQEGAVQARQPERGPSADLIESAWILRKMVTARENLIENLNQLERDIELKVNDILMSSKNVLENDKEVDLIFALAHDDLTFDELQEFTGSTPYELNAMLERLNTRGIVEQTGRHYAIRGFHAK
ncbi:MAG: ArsR family transcriptional regulator [Methanobacteriota archaeon]|nr:MAG: ArsR family transcriptional regulator [Euryarchaeota archaeon]